MNQEFPILELENFRFNKLSDIFMLDHVTHGNHRITVHKHDFYLFFLIEQSSGTHSIDFVDYPVSNYQLHILLPGQVHAWTLAKNTKGYQLMISKKVFETFSHYLQFSPMPQFNHPVLSLTETVYHTLDSEFKQLNAELGKEKLYWDIIYLRCRLIVQLAAREIEEKFKDLDVLKSNPIIVRYIKLVDEYYKQEKSVSFYAEQLNITPNYLNILCKKYTKVSANTIIQNRVLLESKRLLHISEMTIKEIAYHLGFNDLAYFSNFFKAKTGESPRLFRGEL